MFKSARVQEKTQKQQDGTIELSGRQRFLSITALRPLVNVSSVSFWEKTCPLPYEHTSEGTGQDISSTTSLSNFRQFSSLGYLQYNNPDLPYST